MEDKLGLAVYDALLVLKSFATGSLIHNVLRICLVTTVSGMTRIVQSCTLTRTYLPSVGIFEIKAGIAQTGEKVLPVFEQFVGLRQIVPHFEAVVQLCSIKP